MNRSPKSQRNVVEEFVDQVRKYLTLIDTIEGRAPREFLMECAVVLPNLYASGMQLPDVDLPDDDPLEGKAPAVECTMGSIMKVLAGHDVYREVFDPFSDEEAIKGTLSD